MNSKDQPDFSMIIASAVHDMKNSLSMLLYSVDQMCDELPDDWKQKNNTTTVKYEAERVNSYLIQLLGLYRFQNEMLTLHIDEYFLSDLLEEQVAHYEPMLIDKNISLSISADESFAWYFDREIVMGVLNNALNNASRYTKAAIEIVAREENNYLVIEIHDDGQGYPKLLLESPAGEILNNINFQTGSTSLGIYFAEMVTRLHVQGDRKGSIKLSNGGRLGGGVFSIYLP
ncbi:MAG: K+-sensing histidine kinase KdpD [Oleiphilaceae bacterium]|jgi:K+-sensing histidine kinase KdpD